MFHCMGGCELFIQHPSVAAWAVDDAARDMRCECPFETLLYVLGDVPSSTTAGSS